MPSSLGVRLKEKGPVSLLVSRTDFVYQGGQGVSPTSCGTEEALRWTQVTLAGRPTDLRLPTELFPPGNPDFAFAQFLPRLDVPREREALKACQDQLVGGLIFFKCEPVFQELTVAWELLGSHYIIH